MKEQIRPGYYAMYDRIAKGVVEINADRYFKSLNKELDIKKAESLVLWADRDLILQGANGIKLADELLKTDKRISLRFDLESAVEKAKDADAMIMVCEHGLYHNGQLIHIVPFMDETVKQFASEDQNDAYMRNVLETVKELPIPVILAEWPLAYFAVMDKVQRGTFVCAQKK